MCPLTRLVYSLNDCFDDRAHTGTNQQTTGFSCYLAEIKFKKKYSQQRQQPIPNNRKSFSLQKTNCISLTEFNRAIHNSTRRKSRERKKQQKMWIDFDAMHFYRGHKVIEKSVNSTFFYIFFCECVCVRAPVCVLALLSACDINWMVDGCCVLYDLWLFLFSFIRCSFLFAYFINVLFT